MQNGRKVQRFTEHHRPSPSLRNPMVTLHVSMRVYVFLSTKPAPGTHTSRYYWWAFGHHFSFFHRPFTNPAKAGLALSQKSVADRSFHSFHSSPSPFVACVAVVGQRHGHAAAVRVLAAPGLLRGGPPRVPVGEPRVAVLGRSELSGARFDRASERKKRPGAGKRAKERERRGGFLVRVVVGFFFGGGVSSDLGCFLRVTGFGEKGKPRVFWACPACVKKHSFFWKGGSGGSPQKRPPTKGTT